MTETPNPDDASDPETHPASHDTWLRQLRTMGGMLFDPSHEVSGGYLPGVPEMSEPPLVLTGGGVIIIAESGAAFTRDRLRFMVEDPAEISPPGPDEAILLMQISDDLGVRLRNIADTLSPKREDRREPEAAATPPPPPETAPVAEVNVIAAPEAAPSEATITAEPTPGPADNPSP